MYIYNPLNAIFQYNLKGQFIKKISTSNFNEFIFLGLVFIDKDIIAGFLMPYINELKRITFFNTEGVTLDSILHIRNNKTYSNSKFASYSTDGHFFTYNNKLFLKEGYNDTVFCITRELKLCPEYIIDIGKYARNYDDRLLFIEKYSEGKAVNVYFENEKHIIINEGFRKKYILIDKQQETICKGHFYYNEKHLECFLKEEEYFYPSNSPGVYFDTTKPIMMDDGSPTFKISGVSEDGKMLIGYEKSLSPEDNPVVILVKMKE